MGTRCNVVDVKVLGLAFNRRACSSVSLARYSNLPPAQRGKTLPLGGRFCYNAVVKPVERVRSLRQRSFSTFDSTVAAAKAHTIGAPQKQVSASCVTDEASIRRLSYAFGKPWR